MNDNGNVKQKIVDFFPHFPLREQRVAEFVVSNYEQVKSMSNVELAEAVAVSNATVVRFAKRLGYKGYLEFKNALKSEQLTARSPYTSLKEMLSFREEGLLNRYFDSLQNDISMFVRNLREDVLDSMCAELLNARTVYLVGLGSDTAVAMYLNNYLPLIGIRCIPIYEQGLAMREKILHLGAQDVVLMSAFPTIQEDEKWLASYCRESGAPLLIITNSEISAQVLCGNHTIIAGESMVMYYNSCILPMVVCNVLLIRLHEKDPRRAEEALKKYQEVLNRS